MDFAVGAAGVDLFFLISGFVLWLAAERAQPTPAAFLAARAVRVAPLYWLWTLIAAAMAWRRPTALPVVHLGLRHAILSLAFVPHTDPMGGPFPLLPSGWTLTYEAFFYLAFALCLALPSGRRFQALAMMLTITVLVGFAYHRWYTLLANPLLLEFLAGAALARAWSAGTLRRLGGPRAALAGAGVGVSCWPCSRSWACARISGGRCCLGRRCSWSWRARSGWKTPCARTAASWPAPWRAWVTRPIRSTCASCRWCLWCSP